MLMCICHLWIWAQVNTTDTENIASPLTPSIPDSLSAKADSMFYAADSMAVSYQDEKIRLWGNTSVKYQEFTISSDSLLIDLKQNRAYSYGNTVMQDGGQILLGEDVAYDIDSQTGILTNGISSLEKGFYSGENIRKIGSDVYDIDEGRFTTCEYEDPDFWFSAKQLRIYRSDKIVGKPVLAYVNHLPVFYFPYIVVPIRKGRHPGFLIPEPGYNNVDGMFLRDISWYYPYKDYADIILSMDIMEKSGWKAKVEIDYLDRYAYSGNLNVAYQKSIRAGQIYYDWSLRARHHQDLADKSTFDLNLDFVSNKRLWESSESLNESLAQSVTSSISYRKPLLGSNLNIGASYTEDIINDRATVSLPSASFSLPTRPLYELFYKPDRSPDTWWSNLNYNYSIRMDHTGVANTPDRTLDDLIWNNEPDLVNPENYLVLHNFGIRHNLGLSYNWKPRPWLGMQHGLSYNEAWFDRDKNGNKLVRGNDYNAYTNASFNVYGIQNYAKGWLKSVRHILTPTVGLSLNPDFSANDRFFSFGGIGLSHSEKAANLNLALDQKWQIKYGKDSRKINDLFGFTSRVSANLIKDEKQFGSISHTAAFRPGNFNLGNLRLPGTKYSWDKLNMAYNAQYSLTHDPYLWKWNSWQPSRQNFSQTVTFGGTAPYRNYFPHAKNRIFDPYEQTDSLLTFSEQLSGIKDANNWKLSLTNNIYALKSLMHPTSIDLRMDASFKVTSNWTVSYSSYFDMKSLEQISQSVRITRDLHCWKLDISYSTRNEYWEYRISLFNTVLPDALRFQTRDSKKY